MSPLSLALGLGSSALGIVLVGILLTRGMHREFPFFLSYVAVSAVANMLEGLAQRGGYTLYFYTYWTFEALIAILGLLALHEAFRRVFFGFSRIYPWFPWLFPAVVALVWVLVGVYSIQHPAKHVFPIIGLILSLEIGLNIMRTAIFLLFRIAAWLLGARRRAYATGIVDGYTVMAAAAAIYGLRSEFGTGFGFLVQYGVPVAYILAQLVWLDTFRRAPESVPKLPKGMTLEHAVEEMAQSTAWAKELSRKLKER